MCTPERLGPFPARTERSGPFPARPDPSLDVVGRLLGLDAGLRGTVAEVVGHGGSTLVSVVVLDLLDEAVQLLLVGRLLSTVHHRVLLFFGFSVVFTHARDRTLRDPDAGVQAAPYARNMADFTADQAAVVRITRSEEGRWDLAVVSDSGVVMGRGVYLFDAAHDDEVDEIAAAREFVGQYGFDFAPDTVQEEAPDTFWAPLVAAG